MRRMGTRSAKNPLKLMTLQTTLLLHFSRGQLASGKMKLSPEVIRLQVSLPFPVSVTGFSFQCPFIFEIIQSGVIGQIKMDRRD